MSPPDLLSTAEAARRLGIDGSGLRRLMREGRIAARRVGRAWVIEESALASYRRGRGGRPKGSAAEK